MPFAPSLRNEENAARPFSCIILKEKMKYGEGKNQWNQRERFMLPGAISITFSFRTPTISCLLLALWAKVWFGLQGSAPTRRKGERERNREPYLLCILCQRETTWKQLIIVEILLIVGKQVLIHS